MLKPTERDLEAIRRLRADEDFRLLLDYLGRLSEEQNKLMIHTRVTEDLAVMQGRLQALTYIFDVILESR